MASNYRAVLAPGLETCVAREIKNLGGKKAKGKAGIVEFTATNPALYRIMLHGRTFHRIRRVMDTFPYRDFGQLRKKIKQIDWKHFVGSETVTVNLHLTDSKTWDVKRLATAIEEGLQDVGIKVGDKNAIDIDVRFEGKEVSVLLDASGDLHSKRGYRKHIGKAPIRESYAAALIVLSKWTPDKILLDPMCGSGTIAIEAAEIALGTPAGARRKFAIQRWANFDDAAWVAAKSIGSATTEPNIIGSDNDLKTLQAARENVRVASANVALKSADFYELEPPEKTGFLVTNPPYGDRIGEAESMDAFAARINAVWGSWSVTFVAPRKWKAPSKKFQKVAKFPNQTIDVNIWHREPNSSG